MLGWLRRIFGPRRRLTLGPPTPLDEPVYFTDADLDRVLSAVGAVSPVAQAPRGPNGEQFRDQVTVPADLSAMRREDLGLGLGSAYNDDASRMAMIAAARAACTPEPTQEIPPLEEILDRATERCELLDAKVEALEAQLRQVTMERDSYFAQVKAGHDALTRAGAHGTEEGLADRIKALDSEHDKKTWDQYIQVYQAHAMLNVCLVPRQNRKGQDLALSERIDRLAKKAGLDAKSRARAMVKRAYKAGRR